MELNEPETEGEGPTIRSSEFPDGHLLILQLTHCTKYKSREGRTKKAEASTTSRGDACGTVIDSAVERDWAWTFGATVDANLDAHVPDGRSKWVALIILSQ
jgi:hypothetical protein